MLIFEQKTQNNYMKGLKGLI